MGYKSTAIFYKRILKDYNSEKSDMWEILEMMEKDHTSQRSM